jgi:hypothetical protein
MYIVGKGSRLTPASRVSPTTPTIWRGGSANAGPPRPDLNAIPLRVAFGPILPGHRLADDDHSRRGVRVLFVSQVRVDFLCPTLVFLRAMHEAT